MLPLATFMQRVASQPYANQVFFGSDWRKANISRVTLTTTRLHPSSPHVGAIVHERYNGTVCMDALAQRTSLL